MADSTTSGGVGICSLLGVVFVTLKLTGVIDWSWWWVTVPFWGPTVVAFAIAVIIVLVISLFQG